MNILSKLAISMIFVGLSGCINSTPKDPMEQLIQPYWRASSEEQLQTQAKAILDSQVSTEELYQQLKTGPHFDNGVERGEIQGSRIGSDKKEYPYTLLIPDSYDAQHPISVEFNLHGGVNRAKPEPGQSYWRNGNQQFADPNRIIVLPGAWNETYWWFSNQAENIKAILNEVKQRYNVDDNRVYLTGVSDGGTGSFFFAFKQPSEWAAFLPYIGNPGVLSNRASSQRHILFYENLKGKPLFIVNTENDQLYPARAVQKHIDPMLEHGIDHTFTVIPNGGHNTRWLPELKPEIEAFKAASIRDPLPDSLVWTTNQVAHYNRNHWLVIEQIRAQGEPATIEIKRRGNTFDVETNYVRKFSLLLNPEEVDFSRPIVVNINGEEVHKQLIEQSSATLLKWAAIDRDRTMLFTAELTLQTPQ